MVSVAPEWRTLLLANEDRPSAEMKPYRTNELRPALHTPVLLGECLAALEVKQGESYIDTTIGLGGHAERILEANQPQGRLLGIDADREAIRIASSRLARYRDRAVLVSGNFRDLRDIAFDHGFSNVAGIIFDLGISSLQLAEAERGFSFQAAGPLDMRMNPEQDRTAADLVNSLDESDLVTLLQHYGEEPAARHIARTLV